MCVPHSNGISVFSSQEEEHDATEAKMLEEAFAHGKKSMGWGKWH